jgi:hypothetical protein
MISHPGSCGTHTLGLRHHGALRFVRVVKTGSLGLLTVKVNFLWTTVGEKRNSISKSLVLKPSSFASLWPQEI